MTRPEAIIQGIDADPAALSDGMDKATFAKVNAYVGEPSFKGVLEDHYIPRLKGIVRDASPQPDHPNNVTWEENAVLPVYVLHKPTTIKA